MNVFNNYIDHLMQWGYIKTDEGYELGCLSCKYIDKENSPPTRCSKCFKDFCPQCYPDASAITHEYFGLYDLHYLNN